MNDPVIIAETAVDPADMTITALSGRFDAGTLDPRDALDAYAARIESANDWINAFAFLDLEGAQRAAADRVTAWRRSGRCGPLDGVAVAVKDNIDVAGWPTGDGGAAAGARIAAVDAEAVVRLRAAGAIIIGKTRLSPMALGSWGLNDLDGGPRNPWDEAVDRVCGGSSAGSAAAVAAGFAAAALGTDTGGSIRIPAAACGVCGYKPIRAASALDGVTPLCAGFDTLGPIARTPVDLALMAEALGAHPPAGRARVAGLRLVAPPAQRLAVAAEVADAFEAALRHWADRGVRIERAVPEGLNAPLRETDVMMSAAAHAAQSARLAQDPRFDARTRQRFAVGSAVAERDLARAAAIRRAAMHEADAAFAAFDVYATPTIPIAPPRRADIDADRHPLSRFARAANFLDLPAVALPIGDGAPPASIQLTAARACGAALLAIAAALDESRPVRAPLAPTKPSTI